MVLDNYVKWFMFGENGNITNSILKKEMEVTS